MKKYKLLKDLLCFKKGEVHTMDIISISFSPKEAASMCPDSFKDWFEEIKEPSDEEILTRWLYERMECISRPPFKSLWNTLAKELLSKGFNVASLKECEHKWTLDQKLDAAQFVSTWFCSKCGARE